MILKLDDAGLKLINDVCDLALKGSGLQALQATTALISYVNKNIEVTKKVAEAEKAEETKDKQEA